MGFFGHQGLTDPILHHLLCCFTGSKPLAIAVYKHSAERAPLSCESLSHVPCVQQGHGPSNSQTRQCSESCAPMYKTSQSVPLRTHGSNQVSVWGLETPLTSLSIGCAQAGMLLIHIMKILLCPHTVLPALLASEGSGPSTALPQSPRLRDLMYFPRGCPKSPKYQVNYSHFLSSNG